MERELVENYVKAKARKEAADQQLKQANADVEKAESALVEYMNAEHIEATAHHEGVGYVRMQTPRLYASCKADNQDALFGFLSSIGRKDLIKTTVAPQTLSAFVRERIEQGETVPDMVTYYLKPVVRVYGNSAAAE